MSPYIPTTIKLPSTLLRIEDNAFAYGNEYNIAPYANGGNWHGTGGGVGSDYYTSYANTKFDLSECVNLTYITTFPGRFTQFRPHMADVRPKHDCHTDRMHTNHNFQPQVQLLEFP